MSEAREFILAILGISSGFIIPIGVFVWLYKDAKNKRTAIVEIAKTANDPERVQEFLDSLEDGDMFIGVQFLFVLKGVGLLVGSIGIGLIIAGYFFPDDSIGITKAVQDFEKE